MMSSADSLPRRLRGLLALLMAAQAGLGLAFPEAYRDPAWIVAAWFANDWVTLVVVVPLLAIASRPAPVSARAQLVSLGSLAYAGYTYAYYLFGAALNVFFPLYALAFVLGGITLILTVSQLDAAAIAAGFRQQTPVRPIGGYLVFVAFGLAAVWLGSWAAHVFAGRPTPVAPEVFRTIAAIDLTMIVPTLAAGGLLLWRRRPWGYVLAAMAAVQGTLYLIVLSGASAVAIARGLAQSPGELPLWGALAAGTGAVAAALLVNVPAAARSNTSGP